MLKVKVKNFQSITDTSFDIDGFTVILGKNNKGKSALVRSIDAALSNRLGNNFIQWGKLETQVNLKRDDLDITWIKGDSASYKINAKPYTSLRGAVPKPILDAGFRKLEIANEKLNPLIAHQFEELFLINRSGPFVTETLSTLYDLNIINDADSLCQKKLKGTKSLMKTRLSDLETLSEQLERFKGLDDLKDKIKSIKSTHEKVEKLKLEIFEIEGYVQKLTTQITLINKLKEIKTVTLPAIKEASENFTEYQWLNQTFQQYMKLEKLVQILGLIKSVKIPETQKTINLIQEYQWLNQTFQQYMNLERLVQTLGLIKSVKIPEIQKAKNLIQEVQILLEITTELKQTLMACDRCKKVLVDLDNLNILIGKFKKVEEQIQDLMELIPLTNEFMLLIQSVGGVKEQHQQALTDLNSAQKELGKFKICPLCKNPLITAHNHD